jgi:ribosomal protein S27E
MAAGKAFPVVESVSVRYGWGGPETYRLDGKCWNCGLRCTVVYSRGYRTAAVECPNCGCTEIRPEKLA